MDAFVWARALHILGVIFWIGGLATVTLVILPLARQKSDPALGLELFRQVEGIFAKQARFTTLLTGITGFYMLHAIQGWGRYLMPEYWWVHAMTLVWVFFTLMLFGMERVVLHGKAGAADFSAERFLGRAQRVHRVALGVSLVTVVGAVLGAHGVLF